MHGVDAKGTKRATPCVMLGAYAASAASATAAFEPIFFLCWLIVGTRDAFLCVHAYVGIEFMFVSPQRSRLSPAFILHIIVKTVDYTKQKTV